MADGSSVRTKVAQYFVNKKLQELESKDPQIKIDDWTFLQALPQFEYSDEFEPGVDELKPGAGELEPGVDEPQPPPFFPVSSDNVSWKRLLAEYSRVWQFPSQFPSENLPEVSFPRWYKVAIIGAGVAGLHTAKLLQDMGIPYKIFEASDRPGGRIFTYQLPSDPQGNPQGKHDYYDVGAMRFPDNDANKKMFELFNELGLSSKMIKYVVSENENIRYYNGIRTTAAVASAAGDHFKDEIHVPKEYLNKEYIDLGGNKVFGVKACTAAAYDPFREALLTNFDKGWEKLMKHDWASTRSYLTREEPKYPLSVVHWMESRSSGTGAFDRAFSEAILSSLEYDDPKKVIEWWCLEGGSRVLIDAMVSELTIKPLYGHRVTSVKPVYHSPDNLLRLRCWRRQPPPPISDPRCQLPRPHFPFIKVGISGKGEEYFTHVVSTVSFAALGTINTDQVPMTYKQRQAIRTLNYGPAVKVAIKFKTRWWEQDGMKQRGGSSNTDRQSRVVVYPSYGLGEKGPGVLIVAYNLHQEASRFGALIQNSDWSKQLDPDRERPHSEQVLLDQIYEDLGVLHGVSANRLREETLDYHAFDWYHNPYTMGAYVDFTPGQFSTFFADIVQPAAHGRFHFAGELASTHHAWAAGALDSAVRVVDEILRWDFPIWIPRFKERYGRSMVFSDDNKADEHFLRGLFSKELEKAGF